MTGDALRPDYVAAAFELTGDAWTELPQSARDAYAWLAANLPQEHAADLIYLVGRAKRRHALRVTKQR